MLEKQGNSVIISGAEFKRPRYFFKVLFIKMFNIWVVEEGHEDLEDSWLEVFHWELVVKTLLFVIVEDCVCNLEHYLCESDSVFFVFRNGKKRSRSLLLYALGVDCDNFNQMSCPDQGHQLCLVKVLFLHDLLSFSKQSCGHDNTLSNSPLEWSFHIIPRLRGWSRAMRHFIIDSSSVVPAKLELV